jgi:hypothetical protein
MNPDTLFNITCLLAALGWIIILFASPFWLQYDKIIIGVIVVILAIAYSYCNFSNFDPQILSKFSSLDGISGLFQNKTILLACWLHIMAFDLIGAVWMKRNAVKHGIGHGLLIIPLLFTCILGPLGFLIYIIIRAIKTKNYFADNYA